MKLKKYREFIIVLVLIIIYLLSSLVKNNSSYIIFSDKVYKINKNEINKINNNKFNNKKVSLYTIEGIINAYYRLDETYLGAKFNYENGEIINDYYYGFFGDINIENFDSFNLIKSNDMTQIEKLVGTKNDLNDLNYKITVETKDSKIFFLGNFYDDSYYEENSLSDEKKYYELIIYKDSNDSYNVIADIETDKNEFFDTTFYLFKSILKPTNNNEYLILYEKNYGNIDNSNYNLYKIDNNKLTAIGGEN